MTSRDQQPVMRFRVPSQSFVDEVKDAAMDRGETPSVFIRRAIDERLNPQLPPTIESMDPDLLSFDNTDSAGAKARQGFIYTVMGIIGDAEKIDSNTLAGALGMSPKLLADKLRPHGVTPRQLRFPEGKMQGYHRFDIGMASVAQ